MSLAAVILLLQTVLSLLSQPGSASNPAVQSLANQAILMASTALEQPPSTPLGTPDNRPIASIQPVLPIGGPAMAPAPTSSCSLVGTLHNVLLAPNDQHIIGAGISFDWTLTGMDPKTPGQFFFYNPSARSWQGTGVPLIDKDRNKIFTGFGTPDPWKWRVTFGDAECFAYFDESKTIFEGETSSPTPFE